MHVCLESRERKGGIGEREKGRVTERESERERTSVCISVLWLFTLSLSAFAGGSIRLSEQSGDGLQVPLSLPTGCEGH